MHATSRPLSVGCGDEPSAVEVRAALEQLIADPEFPASERRRNFLRFIVEETLAGRGGSLKGSTIAITVFGRDETFDAKADPVVRLEARRLRRDLDSYYVGPGAANTVRFSIPKGGYIPRFDRRGEEALAAPSADGMARGPELVVASDAKTTRADQPLPAGRRIIPPLSGALAVVAAVLALVGIVVLASSFRSDRPAEPGFATPRIAILPFVALDGSQEARLLSAGLGAELLHDLTRFQELHLYQPPEGSDLRAVASRLRMEPGAVYAAEGQIQVESGRVRVDASLRDLLTDEVIWTSAYQADLQPEALVALRGDIASQIATALGQPYGPIGSHVVQRGAAAEVSSLDSYLCVMQAYDYRRDFSAAAFAPTLACLEAAVARDPDYSDAWAMLGWLHLDAGRYGFAGAEPTETQYARALEAARHAQRLAPDSVLALKALSSIQHYRGLYADSERLARRAVELNPYDPDALAQLGWRLAVRGAFDEGVPLLREAIDRSVEPPGWYFHLLAIDRLMRGEYVAMRREAERAALSGRPISEALLAIAAGALGDREAARTVLSRIPPDWDIEAYARRHGAIDEIVTALVDGLHLAEDLAAQPHALPPS